MRVERRCWRVLAPRWAHAPLSGEGAARHGGRWNPPGMPALYLAETLLTAIAEYGQDLGIRPGTFCAYDVAIADIADLTDPATSEAAGLTAGDLLAPWKQIAFIDRARPPGWPAAERLFASGAAGARVPSAVQPGSCNLVLWRWNDTPSRRVTALDPQSDLPLDQRSWP